MSTPLDVAGTEEEGGKGNVPKGAAAADRLLGTGLRAL